MPRDHRVFDPGHLQFITSSTYQRVPVFVSKRLCRIFAQVLDKVRQELGFRLVGWVLMPDHFHLLIQRWRADLKGKVCASLPHLSRAVQFGAFPRPFLRGIAALARLHANSANPYASQPQPVDESLSLYGTCSISSIAFCGNRAAKFTISEDAENDRHS